VDAQAALLPPARSARARFARLVAWSITLLLASAASGCGPVWYTAEIISAESIVSEAEHADAADLSPYEYYLAREYLVKAREQASEASYEDAVHYAQEAHRAGELARDQARTRMRDDDAPATRSEDR
jgi:hypothetical protein